MSFGEFSGFPSNASASTVIAPSYSVRVTRRVSCSQVSSRPCRSRVLPFAKCEGLAEDADRAGLLVPLQDPVVRNVAPQQVAAVAEPDRPFRPAQAGREAFDLRRVDPVLGEGGIEDLDSRIRIALTLLPLHAASGMTDGRGHQRGGRGEQGASGRILRVFHHGDWDRPCYLRRNFFTYAAPTSALVIASTAKLPPCSTKKCFIPDIAVSGQIFV